MSLDTNLRDLATQLGTDMKALRTLINGNLADLSSLTTAAKGSLLAAINELQAEINAVSAGTGAISDTTTGTGTTWSSTKITSHVQSAVTALVNGAPTALDTLKELADALAADDSDIAALVTALDKRVSVAAAQTFTAGEQAQARANIGVPSTADVGPTNTNYVTLYNTAKA